MWVRTAQAAHKRGIYLPIHEIAAALGPATSRALQFIYSFSGRDTISYTCFTGKKTWNKSSMHIHIGGLPALEDFADGDQIPARITADVIKQAKEQWFLPRINSVQQKYRLSINIMYSISSLL